MKFKQTMACILTVAVIASLTACEDQDSTGQDTTTTTTTETTMPNTEVTTTTTETQTQETTASTTEKQEPERPVAPTAILQLQKKTIYDAEFAEGYDAPITNMEWEMMLPTEELEQQYPELAKALSTQAEACETAARDYHNVLKADANERISSNPEGFTALVSTSAVLVRRADNVALSILTDSYDDNGMNGGVRSFGGDNYDVATGKMIFLPDVVNDIDELAKIVEAELFNAYGKDSFHNEDTIQNYFKMYGADGNHWTLEYNGVTMYFSEGEIANRGIGNISITIGFAEHPELFKDKYKKALDSYIVGLPMKTSLVTDLDGDGNNDILTLSDTYEGDPTKKITLDISTQDVSYVETLWASDCESYYVKAGDKQYVYAFVELTENPALAIYEISGTTSIRKVGEALLTTVENNDITSVITDPEKMYLRIFSLDGDPGAPEWNRYFSVDANGNPSEK